MDFSSCSVKYLAIIEIHGFEVLRALDFAGCCVLTAPNKGNRNQNRLAISKTHPFGYVYVLNIEMCNLSIVEFSDAPPCTSGDLCSHDSVKLLLHITYENT